MNQDTRAFINTIAGKMPGERLALTDIRDALNDGEALAGLGVTDKDQTLVEVAYHELYDLIMTSGLIYWDEVAA
jgi:hypothetical protein